MISLGVPWNWILAGAAVCGAALLALSFLRPRCREKVVPSIMLWQGAERRSGTAWQTAEQVPAVSETCISRVPLTRHRPSTLLAVLLKSVV